MKRRGLGMIELIAAVMVLALGGLGLFTVFGRNYRVSVLTRNQVAAAFLAASFFEEVEAHRYGTEKPAAWPSPAVGVDVAPTKPTGTWETAGLPTTQNLPLWVENKPVQQLFHRQWSLRNGSFLNSTRSENWDEVTLTLTWRESSPTRPDSLKQWTVRRLVWRENTSGPKTTP